MSKCDTTLAGILDRMPQHKHRAMSILNDFRTKANALDQLINKGIARHFLALLRNDVRQIVILAGFDSEVRNFLRNCLAATYRNKLKSWLK